MIRGAVGRYAPDLRRTLAKESVQRGYEWAGLRCVDSRAIHLAVWKEEPPPEDVDREVIPLLQDTYLAILAAKKSVRSAKRARRVALYANNVLARIVNLQRYVDGEDSAFDPAEINPALLAAAREAALSRVP